MQQLRYVVAVARTGNFSRAAEQCHVSQPSLSQQIQKLEEELDERLFERMKRQARLTARGEAFLRRAVRILDEVDAARREASDAKELLLALPPKHPLARKRSVGINDLEKERFIVMKEGHCLGDQVLQFCARRDLRARISFRSAQLETIQSLVRAGLGISLVPVMATRFQTGDVPAYRSLQGRRPQRKIVAVWPRQRSLGRAANEFLKVVTSEFGKAGK